MPNCQPNEYYTDIRLVQMGRNRQQLNKDGIQNWMTLGHFSWTQIINLTDKLSGNQQPDIQVNLKGFWEENNAIYQRKLREQSYWQPTYLLREFAQEEKDSVNAFWAKQSAFMLITRIHGVLLDQTEFETILDEKLKDYTHPLLNTPLGKDVVYIRYRAFDLSNVILVMKSDSIYELMMVLGKLYSTKAVGDIYSHFCIREEEIRRALEKKLAVNNDSVWASMRLAVRDARKTQNILSEIKKLTPFTEDEKKKCVFFVTGTEDINLIASDISSGTLCSILCFLQDTLSQFEDKISSVIDDVTTRIGIPEADVLISEEPDPDKTELEKLASAYICMRQKLIRALAGAPAKDWHRTIIEVIDSLIEMSTDCILHQICYILLGTMRGIVERVCNQSTEDQYMENQLNEYLIGITYLMEHILRTESELVHHPETRPLLFDIPASILEFDLAFTDRCARYFKNREIENEARKTKPDVRKYAFLLIPRLYENITIHDRFNRRDDLKRLLYVEIPLSLMYKPLDVACSLVHEVAHHSGEMTRLRNERMICQCYCAAALLSYEIGIGYSDKVIRALDEEIQTAMRRELSENKNLFYLEEVEGPLLENMRKIYRSEDMVISYYDIYLSEKKMPPAQAAEFFDNCMRQYYKKIETGWMISVEESMYQVNTLFSECYADIAMMSLLNIETKEYLELLLKDYERFCNIKQGSADVYKLTAKSNKAAYTILLERVCLVLCAQGEDKLRSLFYIAQAKENIGKFAQDVLDMCCEMQKKAPDVRDSKNLPYARDGIEMCYHQFCVLDAVKKYLLDCYECMTNFDANDANKNEKAAIEDSFNVFARQKRLASDAFLEEIMQYRKRILNEGE